MQRRFLFLQGPHGPFFHALAHRLRATGAEVGRIGFNFGDRVFWGQLPGYVRFDGDPDTWGTTLRAHLVAGGFTDIVCYGASRPIHATARDVADDMGLGVHVFEEGYLRPYWLTYERGGTNAASRLMEVSTERMAASLSAGRLPLRPLPDKWGALRQHVFWGAIYHGLLLLGAQAYPGYRPHRDPHPSREFGLYLKRFLGMPIRRWQRRIATWRIRNGNFPYHVVLLQLAHDANFRDHSPYRSQADFLEDVFRAFAAGAPRHHHLVIKAHPLEDGREPISPIVARLTMQHGLAGRTHMINGGKLAGLLDHAESATTVNSTSAEQALWRGLPIKALGAAVYNRPGFTSPQLLEDFFRRPQPPDHATYLTYRQFLLQTSQVGGGFYSWRGRRSALRRLPDMMLSPVDPYAALENAAASGRQQIRIVA